MVFIYAQHFCYEIVHRLQKKTKPTITILHMSVLPKFQLFSKASENQATWLSCKQWNNEQLVRVRLQPAAIVDARASINIYKLYACVLCVGGGQRARAPASNVLG